MKFSISLLTTGFLVLVSAPFIGVSNAQGAEIKNSNSSKSSILEISDHYYDKDDDHKYSYNHKDYDDDDKKYREYKVKYYEVDKDNDDDMIRGQ